ncbi:GIY-YIG nuclease family protein [Pedobacter glucosidilyticus]|uniref:GIY-YIG nuclease family protein n=1 Tax=Pedobacter glucosidilyticus TaxID=1122941 RepID=UPI0004096DD6|nr:GIY-YIG nuclease family protein [Pedobacter glucosidilyticus]
MQKGGVVYIMTNKYRTTLYIGVTSNLPTRLNQHKTHFYPKSFTARYELTFLIYFECFFRIEEAIGREKELKGWRRSKKNALIQSFNPKWEDLSNQIKEW